jgi:hypothetical protein
MGEGVLRGGNLEEKGMRRGKRRGRGGRGVGRN